MPSVDTTIVRGEGLEELVGASEIHVDEELLQASILDLSRTIPAPEHRPVELSIEGLPPRDISGRPKLRKGATFPNDPDDPVRRTTLYLASGQRPFLHDFSYGMIGSPYRVHPIHDVNETLFHELVHVVDLEDLEIQAAQEAFLEEIARRREELEVDVTLNAVMFNLRIRSRRRRGELELLEKMRLYESPLEMRAITLTAEQKKEGTIPQIVSYI